MFCPIKHIHTYIQLNLYCRAIEFNHLVCVVEIKIAMRLRLHFSNWQVVYGDIEEIVHARTRSLLARKTKLIFSANVCEK